MAYSFNRDKSGIVFSSAKDINASFKDLGAVCREIRYKNTNRAIQILDSVINEMRPILYVKNNKYMGSRHELGGKKGRSPAKCAKIVKKVLVNAMANAESKGEEPQSMYIVHACANKTTIVPRTAPKGVLRLGHSMGRGSIRRTDLELAKVELGIGYGQETGLSEKMKNMVKREERAAPKAKQAQHNNAGKKGPKASAKPKESEPVKK